MKPTLVATASFVLGLVGGVLAAMTLRHELWPLAAHLGILKLYAGVGLVLLLILTSWYLRLQRRIRRSLEQPLAQLFVSTCNFFLAVLLLGGAFTLGLFFVVVH
ncbi:MAG: hypothetical protein ACUVTG_11835 [Candidatus Oleimicrobiaceae bacterium]